MRRTTYGHPVSDGTLEARLYAERLYRSLLYRVLRGANELAPLLEDASALVQHLGLPIESLREDVLRVVDKREVGA